MRLVGSCPCSWQTCEVATTQTRRAAAVFLHELVAESKLLGELQKQIADALDANDFTIEDVAARFVGLAYVNDESGRPWSASFSGELFTRVTGVDAHSADHCETGAWHDTSWPRRHEFAAQFILPASAKHEATNDAQAEESDGPAFAPLPSFAGRVRRERRR